MQKYQGSDRERAFAVLAMSGSNAEIPAVRRDAGSRRERPTADIRRNLPQWQLIPIPLKTRHTPRTIAATFARADRYRLSDWGLSDGHCRSGDTAFPGMTEGPPGAWGQKRQPLKIA